MKRHILDQLLAWKGSTNRKPLLLSGARQVGKTHILKEFGAKHFLSSRYLNFEEKKGLCHIFQPDLDVDRILNELDLLFREELSPDTLIIFDEIQACPQALNSLKYFSETRANFFLVAAGSLLGVQVSDQSFPVGKIDRLWLGAMKFSEFLLGAVGEKEFSAYQDLLRTKQSTPFIHNLLWNQFKLYSAVGGLPAAINAFRKELPSLQAALSAAREVQNNLLKDYLSDIVKHSGKENGLHVQTVFENIPSQLGRSLEGGAKKICFQRSAS